MKVTLIVVCGLLAMVLGWLVWLTLCPGNYALLSDDEAAALDAMALQSVASTNSVTTYDSLESVFGTMMADIAGAHHHVHMQFFKFEDDAVAHQVGDALAAAAARGVESRLLYDAVVCTPWRRYYRQLEAHGVMTAAFGRLHRPLPHAVDYYRNHRKCIVVDGRVAYLGGVNVADRYLHGLPWGRWRDTVVRIEGPAVLAVQRAFAADWRYAGGTLLSDGVYFPAPVAAGNLPVGIVTSGPVGSGPLYMDYICRLLDSASSYIWFETPYFVPPTPLRHALLGAARRGVDVRVLVPPRGDRGELTQWASKSFFAEAFSAGVRIAQYQEGFLHSKIVVSDDRIGVVGSCNVDPRSMLLCQEIAAVVDDPRYAAELRDLFLADEAHSNYIDPARWAQRPLGDKIKETLGRSMASFV